MPATTRSQSRVSRTRRESIPGAFDAQQPELQDDDTMLLMGNLLDELALETRLDCSQHPASKPIDLAQHHVFANADEFCHVVATNGARVLHSLARMVAYDVAANSRVLTEYTEWQKQSQNQAEQLREIQKEVTQVEEELHQSQGKYQDMQKERDKLIKDMELVEQQIQSLHRYNFVKDSELQRAKAKNSEADKLANDSELQRERDQRIQAQGDLNLTTR